MSDKTAETEKAKKGGKSRARIPITGMTCTNCAATIEKGLSETEGVDSANVNFASEKATVEFDPNKVDLGKIKDTISELGYGIATKKSIYPVGGMTCASCVARVEEALKTTPGVVSVVVNLASERATVEVLEGTPYADLKKAVEEAGYELGPEILALEDVSQTAQKEVRKVRDRFIFAAALTVPLMVLSLIPGLAERHHRLHAADAGAGGVRVRAVPARLHSPPSR
jgi:Cu+-exporting ATPase